MADQHAPTLVADAAVFARERHAGQVRKYTDVPYSSHLGEVAGLVAASVHARPALIAAAWLHDSLEDTAMTQEELEAMFGREVSRLVAGVSDVSRPEDGVRAVRKAIDRAHVAQGCALVHSLKLADVISNCSSVAFFDPVFARVYLAEKRALLEVLDRGDDFLKTMARETVEQAMASIALEVWNTAGGRSLRDVNPIAARPSNH